LLQQAGSANDQVFGGQVCGRKVFAADAAVVAQFEVQGVAPIDQHEDGLQQVVAVCAPAGDVQKQIEFGGRGYVKKPLQRRSRGEVGHG